MITNKDLRVGNIVAPTKKPDFHYRITKLTGRRIKNGTYSTIYGYVEMVNKENVGEEFGKESSITYPEWWILIKNPISLRERMKQLHDA